MLSIVIHWRYCQVSTSMPLTSSLAYNNLQSNHLDYLRHCSKCLIELMSSTIGFIFLTFWVLSCIVYSMLTSLATLFCVTSILFVHTSVWLTMTPSAYSLYVLPIVHTIVNLIIHYTYNAQYVGHALTWKRHNVLGNIIRFCIITCYALFYHIYCLWYFVILSSLLAQ